ncbi:MAG TPA: autotransporter-associated beta strand repeat-containing protein, partial [Chthoniobacteraceae bacterium]|nr:autotransporter-associated beta strand repeat-containing protein [Chthoniobacteraceae bacterium]
MRPTLVSLSKARKPQPLACSLARFRNAAAIAAVLSLAASSTPSHAVDWEGTLSGGAFGLPGDGFLWTDANNWTGDTLPAAFDPVTFGNPGAAAGTILLNGDQSVDSLEFTESYTLGSYGERNLLTLTSPGFNVVVNPGVSATINADLAGTNALNLSGGGNLLLNNFVNSFTGPINIDGAGTQLTFRGQGVLPHINSNGHIFVGRSDAYSLGFVANKLVTLSNGGELRVVGTSYNPDSGTKNIVLGAGGGAINVAAGWQQYTIDDLGTPAQISGSGDLTKNGNGRLALLSQDYNLTGNLIVNSGVLDLNRVVNAPITTTFNGTATAVSRFSSFNGVTNSVGATNTITVNGGFLMPNSGTVSVIDAPTVTLNAGALTVQGQDHEYGVRGQVTGGPAFTTLVLNGGSILSRDAYNPLQNRSPRINSLISGSGTINLIGSTAAGGLGGQGHVVFQRSDVGHTFNGTLVLRNYATLENRANQGTLAASINVGKTIGDATLELAGINTMLDMRDNGPGSGGVLAAYATNNINVTATQAGNLQRLSVIRSTGTNTGNTFQFGTLTMGNHRLQVITDASTYNARVASMSLTGTPFLDLATNLQVDGAVNETGGGGQGIIKHLGNSNLTFTGAVNASSVDIRHGNVILSGANGAINPGSISGVGAITVNGIAAGNAGNGTLNAGALLLDNTAGTNADRLNDGVPITMLGNSLLRLTSQGGTNVSETTGNVSIPFGNPTFDVVRTGGAEIPILTLGTAAVSRGANAVLNFTGTGLGLAAGTAQIILPTQAVTGFLGGWAVSGNEFAKYDAFGVTPLTGADYSIDPTEANYLTGINVKITNNTAVTLAGARTIQSLNFQPGAATGTLAVAGNLLSIESGGILSSTNNSTITSTAGGGITANGDGATAASLFVTNNAQLDIPAAIVNNGAGAVTFVKSGTGTLRLTSTTPANTFSGGVVVNSGTLDVWRGASLNGNAVTLAGGTLNLNVPNGGVNNSTIAGFGNNVVVEGNSQIVLDNNGETTGSGTNNLIGLGTLTINGGHTLDLSGFDGYDMSFSGSAFSGTPAINTGNNRDTNSASLIGGAMTGSGFNLIAQGANPGPLILGTGSGDAVSNAGLSSPIVIFGGTMRMNKANNANAVGDAGAGEDVIVNGGTLVWGPGPVGNISANNSNQQGLGPLSPAAARLAGQHQIADTATITLLNGTLGATDQIQNDVVGTLNMFGGTLNSGNSGEGKLEFTVGNISGGTINFNWATNLKFGTLNLLPGAPVIGVANGFIARKTTLEIGSGGVDFNGSRIELQSGGLSQFAGGGAVLLLGGNVRAHADPLNGTSLAGQGIFDSLGGITNNVHNMREFSNSYIDLAGGVRDFNIDDGILFGVSALMTNGGFSKSGSGIMDVQQYAPKVFDAGLFDGPVTVNGGILIIRNNQSLGTALGGVTINAGGTLKVDGSIVSGDSFTITGGGANVTGTTDVQELGALVVDQGQLTINGSVALGGDATIASSVVATTGVAAAPIVRALLTLANPTGVTGTGTLTLSGNGDGLIAGGVNTVAGGLNKNGSGRWEIDGAGSYVGPTVVTVGALRIANDTALGSAAAGTEVYQG